MAVLRVMGRTLWYITLLAILAVVFAYNSVLLSLVATAFNSGAPIPLGFFLEGALVLVGLSPLGQAVAAWTAGFRPPTPAQRAHLTALLSDVRARTGYHRPITLHVMPTATVNACALGTRHVALTEGALSLPREEQEAILAHELGHLSGRHTVMTSSLSLMSTAGNWLGWLAGWIGLGIVLGNVISRRRGRRGQGGDGMALIAFGIALASVVMTLLVMAMWSVYSRQSEYDADAFAGRHGYRRELAAALRRISPTRFTGKSLTNMVWASHPATWRRLRRLEHPPTPPRLSAPPPPAPSAPRVRRF